jgi:transcriptional regulator with XRE-family HTH domain
MPVSPRLLDYTQQRRVGLFRQLMGQKIAARRRQQRWSQEALAHQAGWSRQQLSRVEIGASSIATDRLLALAEVLECEVADLVPTREEVAKEEERMRPFAAQEIARFIKDEGATTPVSVLKRDDGTLAVDARSSTGGITFTADPEMSMFLQDLHEDEIAELITRAL